MEGATSPPYPATLRVWGHVSQPRRDPQRCRRGDERPEPPPQIAPSAGVSEERSAEPGGSAAYGPPGATPQSPVPKARRPRLIPARPAASPGPLRPHACGLGPPPGPGSALPPPAPARLPGAARALLQTRPPRTPGPRPPAPPAAARAPRRPASYLAGPPAASERAPPRRPCRPRSPRGRRSAGGSAEPQPERRRPAGLRAVTLACAASVSPAAVGGRGPGAAPAADVTRARPVEAARVGGAGPGAGLAQPRRGGAGVRGRRVARPFTPTRRDPPDKHPGVAAAGPSHGGPRSPPAMPNPLPAAAQFSGEKTEAQRVSHGRRVAQSAGGGGCSVPGRQVWGRGYGPTGGAPYPTANMAWAPTTAGGGPRGAARPRRRTGRGDGVAQADCKEQGAPGGLYPGNKQPRGRAAWCVGRF